MILSHLSTLENVVELKAEGVAAPGLLLLQPMSLMRLALDRNLDAEVHQGVVEEALENQA
jgi:hypothetical protein